MSLQQSTTRMGSLEEEKELREFLKIARPEWSCPRRRGRNDIARVMSKLRAINVTDVDTLVKRIDENTINSDLLAANQRPPFSREAIDSIKRRRPFMQVLETTDVPLVRQVGPLAPVSQIFSRKAFTNTRAMRSTSSPNVSRQITSSPRSRTSTHGDLSNSGTAMTSVQSELTLCNAGMSNGGRLRLRGAHSKKRRQPTYSSTSDIHNENTGYALAPHVSAKASARTSSPSDTSCVNTPMGGEELPMRTTRSMRAVSWQAELPSTVPGTPEPQPFRRLMSVDSLEDTAANEDVKNMHRMSVEIQRANQERSGACWTCGRHKTALQQAEEMLREQNALDERRQLVRTVAVQDLDMPFRSHVAHNIGVRLKEEKKHDEMVGGLAMQQQCQNIRKQINLMVNSRRELASIRSRWQSLAEGDNAAVGGKLGGFAMA